MFFMYNYQISYAATFYGHRLVRPLFIRSSCSKNKKISQLVPFWPIILDISALLFLERSVLQHIVHAEAWPKICMTTVNPQILVTSTRKGGTFRESRASTCRGPNNHSSVLIPNCRYCSPNTIPKNSLTTFYK